MTWAGCAEATLQLVDGGPCGEGREEKSVFERG